MHPDQFTPDSHRYSAPDSDPDDANAPSEADPQAPPVGRPEQDQADDDAETTSQNVATPEPEGKRLGEAGGAYTGRQMDDRLKSSPRVDDARDVTDDEGEG